MLKKIINQIKNISPRLLNLIFFFITLAALLIIAFYQLFVDQNYRFFSPKKFLKPSFLVGLYKKIKKTDIKTWPEVKSGNFLDFNSFISPQKDKTASIEKENDDWILKISKLTTRETEKSVFDSFSALNIIQWDKDNQRIYLAYQKDSPPTGGWEIGVFNNGELKAVIENIVFPKSERLVSSIEPIDSQIIYPQCDPTCKFVIYNLKKETKESISIVDETPDREFFQVELKYFDTQAEKIIYQLPDKDMAYIIDFTSYLWHYLYLRPEPENLIEIKGIFVNSQGEKKLVVFSNLKNQVYLYDINGIGLKIIDDVDEADF